MKNPMIPKSNIIQTFIKLLSTAKDPNRESIKINVARIAYGSINRTAKDLIPSLPQTKVKILAINMAKKITYNTIDCSDKNYGTACIHCKINAAKITAVVGLPGIPSIRVGIMAPPAAALLDVSGATTPSSQPFPNSSEFLLVLIAIPYLTNEAIDPPVPGN